MKKIKKIFNQVIDEINLDDNEQEFSWDVKLPNRYTLIIFVFS